MTNEQLAEIRARAEAATPGPWSYYEELHTNSVPVKCYGVYPSTGLHAIVWSEFFTIEKSEVRDFVVAQERKNYGFIAHAREDIPALLAEIDRLRRMLGPS